MLVWLVCGRAVVNPECCSAVSSPLVQLPLATTSVAIRGVAEHNRDEARFAIVAGEGTSSVMPAHGAVGSHRRAGAHGKPGHTRRGTIHARTNINIIRNILHAH